MSGWVSVKNFSGKNFEKTRIKLIAGNVNKVVQKNQVRSRAMVTADSFAAQAAPEAVSEKKFDEFHLYSLPGEIDMRDQETKQLEFVRADPVETTKEYLYDGFEINYYSNGPRSPQTNPQFGTGSSGKVKIYRSFVNSEENNLGIPLPAGTVRFYRADTDGQIEFIGENTIDHTPKDETVRLYLGDAFDIVAERTQDSFYKHPTQDMIRETFSIEVRNRSEEDVEVKVIEHLFRWSNWKILSSSIDYEKTDATTLQFIVPVAAGETETVTYSVEYTW